MTKIAAEYFQLKLSTFQVAVNETVKHCYRPLVSDCDVEGKLFHFVNLLSAVAFNQLYQVPCTLNMNSGYNALFSDPDGGECKEYFESSCTTRYIEKVQRGFYEF